VGGNKAWQQSPNPSINLHVCTSWINKFIIIVLNKSTLHCTFLDVGNALRMALLILPQLLCRQPSNYETRSISLATMNDTNLFYSYLIFMHQSDILLSLSKNVLVSRFRYKRLPNALNVNVTKPDVCRGFRSIHRGTVPAPPGSRGACGGTPRSS